MAYYRLEIVSEKRHWLLQGSESRTTGSGGGWNGKISSWCFVNSYGWVAETGLWRIHLDRW